MSQRSLGSDRLLLHEMSHRINNQLAATLGRVQVAVAMTRSSEVIDHLLGIKCQLENFARVQELLQLPRFRTRVDGLAYLSQLCPALQRLHLQHRGVELVLLRHMLLIDSEQCWAIGMILAELVTNAAKHAFCDRPGRMVVKVARKDSVVCCRTEDNGIGSRLPHGEQRGLHIVNALARELNGQIAQELSPSGCTTTVWFRDVTD